MLFQNREEAGKALAREFVGREDLDKENTVVLAIPRGGVPVAYPVAQQLGCTLDIVVTRKIPAPGQEEFAIGAVAPDGQVVLDDDLVKRMGVTREYLSRQVKIKRREIDERLAKYRHRDTYPTIPGRQVVLVDDGVATGSTIMAAAGLLRSRGAGKIIIAVPVAPPETLSTLRAAADSVHCIHTPIPFWAVGQYYVDFTETSDQEVKDLLVRAASWGDDD